MAQDFDAMQYLSAIHEAVQSLATRVVALESGFRTSSGVAYLDGGGVGLESEDFQKLLPDIPIPWGTADGDLLIWDAATSKWVPSQPDTPVEPEPGEGVIPGWEWDAVNEKWVQVYHRTTIRDVVTAVTWDADTKQLKYTTYPMRVIVTEDEPDVTAVLSAATVDAVTDVAYSTETKQFTQTKTPIFVWAYEDAEEPTEVFTAEPCEEGEGVQIKATDPYTGRSYDVWVQKVSAEE